ncbi:MULTISPECIES: DUF3995 domain-containing protein [unclassified Sphingobacterium]|uniref:DUF3995 domain-containing protein n=1 Tax=unclassified Sphingobacterium TaxID=2609468 RepID=UPI0032E4118F
MSSGLWGGQWAINAVIPTDLNGRKLFTPRWPGTILVGVGLLIFALINLGFIGTLDLAVDSTNLRYCMFGIGVLFFLRFIGEFKYVGLFKKFRQSAFATRDTYIYIPLCLFLSFSHIFLAFAAGWEFIT